MLINTVILFLRDALPIFILMGMLLAQLPLTARQLILSIGVGLLCTWWFTGQIDPLSQWFDGSGVELVFWLLHLSIYLLVSALGLAMLKPLNWRPDWLAISLIVVIFVAKGSNFWLYFSGYWHQQTALQSMTVGTLLGLGICLSLATLLYFFIQWLSRRWGALYAWLVLLIFASGQLTQALNLLVQVDWLPAASPVWNSQWLVDNESEYGHLLNVLLGYIATPTLMQLLVYASAILLPLALLWQGIFLTPSSRGKHP